MSDAPDRFVPAGSKVALAVLVTLVVLSPWPFGSAHLRTTQAIALISLATALGALLWDSGRGRLQLPPRVLLWPLLGLWALAVFQLVPLPAGLHRWLAPGSAAVWHPDVPAAAAVLGPGPHPISLFPEATCRWIAFATGVVALALAASPALRDRRLLLRSSISVVTGGFLVAAYGLFARLAFGDKLYGFLTVPTVAPFGPFVSKNHFAGYVELAACLAVGLAAGLAEEARRGPGHLRWLESRRAGWVVATWGAAGTMVLSVGVSLSRGGVVSLVGGMAAFAAIRFWTRRRAVGSAQLLGFAAVGLLVAAAGVGSVLPSDARSRVLTLFSHGTRGPDPFRVGVWRDSLRLVATSPIVGSGFGAFADALPRFKTAAGDHRVEHAESDHLELVADGGLAAGTLAALAGASLLGLGLRRLGTESDRLTQGLGTGALAGVVALLVHSSIDFNLRIPSNGLLAALLLACAVPPAAAKRPHISTRRGGAGRPYRLGASSLLACPVVIALVGGLLCPWAPRAPGFGGLLRVAAGAAPGLRGGALEADVIEGLRCRPADARAWAALAWLRLRRASQDADELAGWSQSLDPQHARLGAATQRVRDGVRRRPR